MPYVRHDQFVCAVPVAIGNEHGGIQPFIESVVKKSVMTLKYLLTAHGAAAQLLRSGVLISIASVPL